MSVCVCARVCVCVCVCVRACVRRYGFVLLYSVDGGTTFNFLSVF